MDGLGMDVTLYLTDFLESVDIVSLATTCTKLRAILWQSDRVWICYSHRLRPHDRDESGLLYWPNASWLSYVEYGCDESTEESPWLVTVDRRPIRRLHVDIAEGTPTTVANHLLRSACGSLQFLSVLGEWPWEEHTFAQCVQLESVTLQYISMTREVWSMLASLPKLYCLRLNCCRDTYGVQLPLLPQLKVLEVRHGIDNNIIHTLTPYIKQLHILSIGVPGTHLLIPDIMSAHNLMELRLTFDSPEDSRVSSRNWATLATHPSIQYIFIRYCKKGKENTNAELHELLKLVALRKHVLVKDSALLVHSRWPAMGNAFSILMYEILYTCTRDDPKAIQWNDVFER